MTKSAALRPSRVPGIGRSHFEQRVGGCAAPPPSKPVCCRSRAKFGATSDRRRELKRSDISYIDWFFGKRAVSTNSHTDIEERSGIRRKRIISTDRSVMNISLASRAYKSSKAEPITTEATDWRVVATMGFAVLVTVAWNGMLLWLIWQLF